MSSDAREDVAKMQRLREKPTTNTAFLSDVLMRVVVKIMVPF